MGLLYLRLSFHLTGPRGETILGLSIDEEPSEVARCLGEARAAATGGTQGSIAISSTATAPATVVDLKVETPGGESETVVLTVAAGPANPQENYGDVSTTTLEATLTPQGVLTISSTTHDVWLVPLTPLLIPLARPELATDKCRALLADGSGCRLKRTHKGWCFFHHEHHALLHDEQLAARKWCHDAVRKDLKYMAQDSAANIDDYNTFQESLALRILITQILWAGDEDDGHKTFVKITLQNRASLGHHLHTANRSDGAGRVSISACIGQFLPMVDNRDTYPTALYGGTAQLKVDLADVRTIRASVPANAPTPSLFNLFSVAGSTHMLDNLYDRAARYRDLPNLVPQEMPYEQLTWEQQCRFDKQNTLSPPESPRSKAITDKMMQRMEAGDNNRPTDAFELTPAEVAYVEEKKKKRDEELRKEQEKRRKEKKKRREEREERRRNTSPGSWSLSSSEESDTRGFKRVWQRRRFWKRRVWRRRFSKRYLKTRFNKLFGLRSKTGAPAVD